MAKAEASSPGKNPKNPKNSPHTDSATASTVIRKPRGFFDRLFGRDPQPVETVRTAEPAHTVSQQTQVQDVQPRRKNLLQRIFTGDDDARTVSKGKEVYREEGGSLTLMATMDSAGHGSVQPGATGHSRKVTSETHNGITTAHDRRVSIDSPPDLSTRIPTEPNRDNARARVTGQQRGDHQRNFSQTMTYSESGNTVTGNVKGTTQLSTRSGAGKYNINNTSAETTGANGDRYYQDEGRGFLQKINPVNWFRKDVKQTEETAVLTHGRGYRAADQSKNGLLSADVFVTEDQRTGKPMQIERSAVERYLKDGHRVTRFTHQQEGESGRGKTYYVHEVTQPNPNKPSEFTYKRFDSTQRTKLAEAGSGNVTLNRNNDLVVTENFVQGVVGGKFAILSAALNLGAGRKTTTSDLDVTVDKKGELALTSYGSTQKSFTIGIGAAISPVGGGPFAYASVQGNKITEKAAEEMSKGYKFTETLIGPNGAFGERVARTSLALIYLDKNSSESTRTKLAQAEVEDKYFGHARARSQGSSTVKALDEYFALGGTVEKLEAMANSKKVSSDIARSRFTPALQTKTAEQMMSSAAVPTYHGADFSVNNHSYYAKDIHDGQVQAVDRINGPRDNQPVPKNMTRVLVRRDDNTLMGVDVKNFKIKNVDTVILSVDKFDPNPGAGHGVGITMIQLKGDTVSKTSTVDVKTLPSSLQDILHIPIILNGHKTDRPNTPNNPNDQKIPNVPPQECCPPGSPLIPHATPQQCCGGILGKLFGR